MTGPIVTATIGVMSARVSSSGPGPGQRRGTRTAVLVSALVLVCATGCGGRSRTFFAVHGAPTSTELQLNVNSCNENLATDVSESATEVRVRVMSDRKLGRSGGDCADSVTVNLSEPLGTRRVVDDSSGEVVQVQEPE